MNATYPITKSFLVRGVKVELVLREPGNRPDVRIYSTQSDQGDKMGMLIYRYLINEKFFDEPVPN
jgi:hypothetical protein